MVGYNTVFLFGEAEKGPPCAPLLCHTLLHLFEQLGNAPTGSTGLSYAIQSLLHNRSVIYFRIEEEGFSTEDYLRGFALLHEKSSDLQLCAIGLPGVGDRSLIDKASSLCQRYHSLLLISEKDLYDFLTHCF